MRLTAPSLLTPEQQRLHADFVERRGGVRGPFVTLVHSPRPGALLEQLAAYCSGESTLPVRLRELALLTTARVHAAQHAWIAHVDKAVAAGIDRAALHRLARNEDPGFAQHDERVLHRFAVQALTEHAVDDDTFNAALQEFGERALVDLVVSLGTFTSLALLLTTFEVDLPPHHRPPFPDVRGHAPARP